MSKSLWDHQRKAIDRARLLNAGGFAFFHEPGTGKTATTIRALCESMNKALRYQRTLIFCPPMVISQWVEEWAAWSELPKGAVVGLYGSGKKRLETFNRPGATVCVMNYESLLMDPLFDAMVAWKPDHIVFDESHLIKNPLALRSKAADRLANPRAPKTKQTLPKPNVFALTGTPVLKNPMDLFQQFKCVYGGWPDANHDALRLLTSNFSVWRDIYFRDRNRGMPHATHFPDWQIRTLTQDGFDGMGEIARVVARFSDRVTKADCLDLPDEISVVRHVGMLPGQKKVYDDLEKDLVAYMGDMSVATPLAVTKALRLLQITAGFVPMQEAVGDEMDTAQVHFEKTPKEEALKELLEMLTPHSKVMVWAVWRENYRSIRKVLGELGLSYCEVHGELSDKAKRENVLRFQTDPVTRVLLGNPASGGVGLNLTIAPYDITYSRTPKLVDYLQARARNHRGGQTSKVTHYDLVVENTIDAGVLDNLARKIDVSGKILGDVVKNLASRKE